MSFYRCWLLLTSVLFLASCTTTQSLKKGENLSNRQLSERGIIHLKNGQYENARLFFSQALKQDPKNCQFHFLNALSYQLQGKTGNYRLLDVAASGYRSAIKFCPNDPWPYYYLGLIELQEKNFQRAEALFFQAMQHSKSQKSIAYLKAFIKSAQRAHDYTAINQIIAQIEKLDPKSPMLKELRKIRDTIPKQQPMTKRASRYSKASYSKASTIKHDEKQVLIDAVLIVSRETQARNRGVNLLNGLQLQYGNTVAVNNFTTSNFFKYANAASRAGYDIQSQATLPTLDYSTLVTHAISIPDITYNLNIFNDVNEHDKLLSRPTLLARDGKTSTYFSGNRLIVGVSGLNTGQIESIPIGLTMKVTPTFQKNGSIDLDIEFGKEQLISSTSPISASNINSVATTAKENTNTSVNIHFGETVILSAFSEGIASLEDNRTPGLGDLPLIRYLFSNKIDGKRNTSILVLLTPHKQIAFEGEVDNEQEIANVKDFYKKFPDAVSNFNKVLTHLSKSGIYDVFTTYHDDFYSDELVNEAVDYSSNNVDDY